MSFLTEYIDQYKEFPLRVTKPFPPERHIDLGRKWLDPKKGKEERELTDEEIRAFIKEATRSMRGESNYYYTMCAHHDPALKGPLNLRPKKKKQVCKTEEAEQQKEDEGPTMPALLLKETELMKKAHELYNKDMNEPTLEPPLTTPRILGYVRPSKYKTGLSEYQASISRLAYELVRDDKIHRIELDNGKLPRWGYPPEGIRQPVLDGAPYDGERLY